MHLGRDQGAEVERRGRLVVDQGAGDGLGLVDRGDDRVAVAEVVGLDDDGVGVVAELGEVGQVARGGEGDRVDVREAVERIGVVGDRQQFLAVVGAVDAGDVPVAGDGVVLDVGVAARSPGRRACSRARRAASLPVVSQTRNWTLTVSATKPLPTAALVSGGKQPQFEPLKSMPSMVVPSDRAAGVLEVAQRAALLVVARLLGRGDVLGGGQAWCGAGW